MKTTAIVAAAELIGDKLPFTPNRTKLGPLITRAVSGALGGAAIASGKKRSALAGAIIGAAAAIGATYGFYQLRKMAAENSKIPDPVIALAEDALVVGSGLLLRRSLRMDNALVPRVV
jgi:uncharacterized membrane protein